MIPADLSAELSRAVSAVVAAGALPAAAQQVAVSGTWRPAPRGYATSLPFALARLAGQPPAVIARQLLDALPPVPWISSARPAGGYLTITVTAAALASVAVRVARAGPACARGSALAGRPQALAPLPDLSAAPSWPRAWRSQTAAVTARLAETAGATMVPALSPELRRPPALALAAGVISVADCVAYAGGDAVRYALTRTPAGRAGGLSRGIGASRGIGVSRGLPDPWYLVSLARADAASVPRWAGGLQLCRAEPDQRLAGLLSLPSEIALLTQLSWLPERVAGAARRGRPAELASYLERTARLWLDCRESSPALPFGGQAAPRDLAGISARLWLAAAAHAALAAGLDLVGVTPCHR